MSLISISENISRVEIQRRNVDPVRLYLTLTDSQDKGVFCIHEKDILDIFKFTHSFVICSGRLYLMEEADFGQEEV